MMKPPERMGMCKVCGLPFSDNDTTATTCKDCLIRDFQRQAHEMWMRVRVEPHRLSRFQALRAMAATAFMAFAIAAAVLCFIGWIWQGLQVLRLILGGE